MKNVRALWKKDGPENERPPENGTIFFLRKYVIWNIHQFLENVSFRGV